MIALPKKMICQKKLTASIIFSYEYEMITNDELLEAYNDNIQDFQ